MLKILGSLIVILATSIIGFSYAKVYGIRVKQIRNMQYALSMLESEIIYTATPLIQAFQIVGERAYEGVRELFVNMSEMLKQRESGGVFETFNKAYEKSRNILYFEKEEVEVIASFMQSLGSSDIEGQKKNFNITIKKLEEFEKKAEEARIKNEKLYKYFGVCAGMIIVIILV